MGTLNMAEVDVGSTFQAVVAARRGESNLGVYFTTDDGALSELQISALETTAAFRFTVTYRV
jgi:hypothetical protein